MIYKYTITNIKKDFNAGIFLKSCFTDSKLNSYFPFIKQLLLNSKIEIPQSERDKIYFNLLSKFEKLVVFEVFSKDEEYVYYQIIVSQNSILRVRLVDNKSLSHLL